MCFLPQSAIVVFVAFKSKSRDEKEEEDMNHYMDFDPHLIRERNQQMRKEVNSLRLEERLRKERSPRGSRLSVLIKRVRLLIGGARLAD
jgi:hypothetical protein